MGPGTPPRSHFLVGNHRAQTVRLLRHGYSCTLTLAVNLVPPGWPHHVLGEWPGVALLLQTGLGWQEPLPRGPRGWEKMRAREERLRSGPATAVRFVTSGC